MQDDVELKLVTLAQAGDRGALEEIVRRTSRFLFAHLYYEVRDPHRAEDLLQETWLRAYASLDRLKNAPQLRGWLLTIARNVLTDDARYHGRRKRSGTQTGDPEILRLQADDGPSLEDPGEQLQPSRDRQQVHHDDERQ